MKELAAGAYKSVLNQTQPDATSVYIDIAKWFFRHDFEAEAERAFETAVRENPNDQTLYLEAADYYSRKGNQKKAEENKIRAREVTRAIDSYSAETILNYNEIAHILAARRIPLICMQYPLRSIDPLKSFLTSNYSIIFVENKTNFEEALKEQDYYKIFSDSFAGDFGHCTQKGNRLIAQRLADVILSQNFIR